MAAEGAVRATAIARQEVRRSLDRLTYHLERGPRGLRGVNREVAFLNALHRQNARLGAVSVGQSVAINARRSFGDDALKALVSSDTKSIGRMKSSLLADFSADGLASPRSLALQPQVWVWVANSSACPSCLDNHGTHFEGGQPFVPLHPSCLCIPEVPNPEVRELTDEELIAMQRTYGDPRYSGVVNALEQGGIARSALRSVEAVNRTARGAGAVGKHDLQGVVRQNSLGAGDDLASVVDEIADEIAEAAVAAAPEAVQPVSIKAPLETKATKAEIAALRDAERLVAEALADVDPKYVRGLQGVADRVNRFATMKASSPNYKLNGLWEERTMKKVRGKGYQTIERRLSLQVARRSEAYSEYVDEHNAYYKSISSKRLLKPGTTGRNLDDWIDNPDYIDDPRDRHDAWNAWRAANSEPRKMRAATAEELADTYIHELAHVLDWQDEALTNSTPLRTKVVNDGIKSRVAQAYSDGDEAFWYAKTKPGETIAELFRMYFMGDRHGAKVGTRTAAQWRKQYPEMAKWVEDNLLTKLNRIAEAADLDEKALGAFIKEHL